MKDQKINHRPPQSSDSFEISTPKEKSVGMPAVVESLRQMNKYMDMPKALRASLKMNQKGGFDCPGCAWPDPDDERSPLGEYCENGIKALAEEATKFRANPDFFLKHSIAELSAMSDFTLGKSGRLTQPMYLAEGDDHYRAISWEAAFKKMAAQLNAVNPNEAIFYTSGRTSNEAAFLYQLFVRAYGTNNLPDCSNMCHESSGKALSQTLGIGKGSVTLEDIHQADLIMVMGQNPGTNHPRMLSALEKNKANGGTIIAVNPMKEAGLVHYTNPQKVSRMLMGGVDLTDLYLPIRINGDLAFVKALMILLLEKEEKNGGVFDHDFIKAQTTGYDEVIASIKTADFDTCVKESGLQEADIRKAAELIVANKNMIICWAMGITQQVNGVDTIKEIVNLLLLRGSIGKSGAGTCPVRGHSNVQGDRTMGIYESMSEGFHQKLDKAFGIQTPREHGYATIHAIEAMYEKKAKVFFAMGGNFLSAAPDTDYTAEGLRNCELTVHVSTKPNRSHLVHGKEAIILPCLGRTEMDMQASGYQFVSVENSMGVVHSSKGVLSPLSPALKSEVAIVAGLAKAVFANSEKVNIDWNVLEGDYDKIREKIEEVIPGFEDYNNRVREKNGFELPNGARTRNFSTSDGKAHFTVNALPENEIPAGHYHLGTVRSHDQYNTTIYGLDDRYRGIKNGREVILMNKKDMQLAGFKAKDKVNVHSIFKGKTRSIFNFSIVPYDLPQGNLMAYFPEANPLVPIDSFALESFTPVSKRIVVKLERVSA